MDSRGAAHTICCCCTDPMRVVETPIPAGSHELAIWPNLTDSDTDTGEPIVTVCNLHRLSQHECIVTKAHGELSDEINIAIGLKAYTLGYRTMHFKVAHGSPASHWAKFEKAVNGMDFYRVDLVEAIEVHRSAETKRYSRAVMAYGGAAIGIESGIT
jgi:hypothetical protein